MKIANIHRYFDVHGNYHGPANYKFKINGEEHDVFEYAKQHGIKLPKHKKQINKDIEEEHGDMESSHDSGHTEEHGDGDSESTE